MSSLILKEFDGGYAWVVGLKRLAMAEERSTERASGDTRQRGVLYCVIVAPLNMKRSTRREKVPRCTMHNSKAPIVPIFLDVTYPASTNQRSINAAQSANTSACDMTRWAPIIASSWWLVPSYACTFLDDFAHLSASVGTTSGSPPWTSQKTT